MENDWWLPEETWRAMSEEQQRQHRINVRAYFLSLDRQQNGTTGSPEDDWAAAEQEETRRQEALDGRERLRRHDPLRPRQRISRAEAAREVARRRGLDVEQRRRVIDDRQRHRANALGLPAGDPLARSSLVGLRPGHGLSRLRSWNWRMRPLQPTSSRPRRSRTNEPGS